VSVIFLTPYVNLVYIVDILLP